MVDTMIIYELMHENVSVAAFTVRSNGIDNIAIKEGAESLLPFGIFNKEQLTYWIEHRGIPTTRYDIKRELKITPFQYMLENLGLSLTDHYWIHVVGDSYTWTDVNFFDNDFKYRYSLNIEDGNSIANKTNFVPNASLQGDLKKKWIIDSKGIRRLVKGNYDNTCRQSISEVLATEIHKRQNKFNYTPYSFVKIKNNGNLIIGCECPNFVTNATEFVPAIDIVRYLKVPNNMSLYEFYIAECKRQSIDVRPYLEYQIMTDFIITNTDRHLNNFGILRDSRTGKFLTYAPIFDSGNSMFYKGYIPVGKKLLDIDVTSFTKKEVKLMSYVTNKDLVNISLLPSDDEVYNLLKVDETVNEETNERIVRAYNMKIKFLEDFQNGAKIWSYNYRK